MSSQSPSRSTPDGGELHASPTDSAPQPSPSASAYQAKERRVLVHPARGGRSGHVVAISGDGDPRSRGRARDPAVVAVAPPVPIAVRVEDDGSAGRRRTVSVVEAGGVEFSRSDGQANRRASMQSPREAYARTAADDHELAPERLPHRCQQRLVQAAVRDHHVLTVLAPVRERVGGTITRGAEAVSLGRPSAGVVHPRAAGRPRDHSPSVPSAGSAVRRSGARLRPTLVLHVQTADRSYRTR